MVQKNAMKIIEKIKDKLCDEKYKVAHRASKKDFTRQRKLPFVSLVLFMLNVVKQTLQKELTQFMDLISTNRNISKSAFCQSRLKLKPEAFVDLNDTLVHEFYTDNDEKRWKGFRLTAIDGSTVNLPYSKDILKTFGGAKNNSESDYPMGRISSFYDVLNDIIIDTQISHYDTGELDLALAHMEKAGKDDLIIEDRGYCAVWWFYSHLVKNTDFVIRLRENFLSEFASFWNSNETSKAIEITSCPDSSKRKLNELGLKFKPFKVRLVKVILHNGDVEVLITSLIDEEKYPTPIFKELYFMRWGVEVNYDHLKNNIELENFTGLSSIAVKQDFFANMFIANLQAIIARDAQFEIDKEKRSNKRKYKVNKNLSLGFMKDRVIKILTSDDPNYFEELKKLFKMEPVPIRENRTFPRNFHRTRRKYFINKKKAV